MTTITKERLLTIKQWRETYGPGSNVVLPAEEAEELARIALASLEAEAPSLPGGFTIKETQELYEDLVRSHISQALSGEKMKKKDRDADLRWIHGVIVQAGWFVKASLEQNALSGNSPLIPGEVLSAIREVARIRADFDDFDGDRRGIGDCLDEAEQELIVTINKYASQLAAEPIATNDVREQTAVPPVPVIQADVAQAIEKLKRKLVECNRYNYCADAVKGVEDACHAAMLQGIQPVSQAYNLPELIEGMEVSIDVSTCDADLGNRYFGTVTEALELDTAKNGYILLVQDAEPNFDVNGNSPVTPDGWISCSERMPVIGELNWRTSFPLLVTCGIGVIPAYYGFVRVNGNKHYGFMESLKYGDDSGNHPQTNEYDLISNVTHWMPLPEPPQEVS